MVTKKQTARSKASTNKRRVVLYLPTLQMVDTWHKAAKKANMTTSSFIQNIVNSYFENGIPTTKKQHYEKQITEYADTIKKLQQENIELSKKVKMLDTLADRNEQELQRLRNKDFMNESFEGEREYKKQLIKLLQKEKNIKEHQLLSLLHIDPTDTEAAKAINRQLQELLDFGVIKMYRGGYEWKK